MTESVLRWSPKRRKALDAVTAASDVTFEKTRFSLGAARYLETGDTLTDDDLNAISSNDAIMLGAVGGMPGVPAEEREHRARAAA